MIVLAPLAARADMARAVLAAAAVAWVVGALGGILAGLFSLHVPGGVARRAPGVIYQMCSSRMATDIHTYNMHLRTHGLGASLLLGGPRVGMPSP
jgi:hypothetical protein